MSRTAARHADRFGKNWEGGRSSLDSEQEGNTLRIFGNRTRRDLGVSLHTFKVLSNFKK